jgi:hypothetical protein
LTDAVAEHAVAAGTHEIGPSDPVVVARSGVQHVIPHAEVGQVLLNSWAE